MKVIAYSCDVCGATEVQALVVGEAEARSTYVSVGSLEMCRGCATTAGELLIESRRVLGVAPNPRDPRDVAGKVYLAMVRE